MTEPEIDVEEVEEVPTRRLAYILLNDGNIVIGRTVLDVPEDQYDSEKERLNAAHMDNRHVELEDDEEVPEVGTAWT